jgi:predicted RNase H-like HicB family nuclease
MKVTPCNEIITEYDADSCSYYIFWQPPAVIAAGKTEREALEDFREAVRFCIEETADRKMKKAG